MLVFLINKIAKLRACKENPTQMFSCEYCKILKNTFFCRIPSVAASVK